MYEYKPSVKKTREKLVATMAFVLAALAFCAASAFRLRYLFVYQFLGAICLMIGVTVVTRYLMRSYRYRLAPSDGFGGETMDFSVIESYAGRVRTVCRISLSDIVEVSYLQRENQKALRAEQRGKCVYYYVEEMKPRGLCLLSVRDGEETLFVQIVADERLYLLLKSH